MRSELRRTLLKLLRDQGMTPMQISLLLLWSPQRVVDVLDRAHRAGLVEVEASLTEEVPRWSTTQRGEDWLTRAEAEEA